MCYVVCVIGICKRCNGLWLEYVHNDFGWSGRTMPIFLFFLGLIGNMKVIFVCGDSPLCKCLHHQLFLSFFLAEIEHINAYSYLLAVVPRTMR